jgi:hypothetical protein
VTSLDLAVRSMFDVDVGVVIRDQAGNDGEWEYISQDKAATGRVLESGGSKGIQLDTEAKCL